MRVSILALILGTAGLAAAEQPAHDQTCQCSCVPTASTPIGRGSTTSSGTTRGTDIEPPILPPRPVPRDDRGTPHPFDTPSQAYPATPGIPTPSPWRD